MTDAVDPLRPRKPIQHAPGGYSILENYSSLQRYWSLLRGLHGAGLAVEVPARTPPDSCRRAILGVRYDRAGGLLDAEALRAAITDEDGRWALEVFTMEPAARDALEALAAGNRAPVQAILSERYTLNYDLVLAFTAARQLALRAQGQFWPLDELDAPLPLDLPLKSQRLRKEDMRALLDRLAAGIRPPGLA